MKFRSKLGALALIFSITTAVGFLGGCNKTPAPLPALAADATDAHANEVLQPAHAFAARITAAVQSTDPQVHIELTAQQKSILVNLNKALNVADGLEQAYHANATPAAATQLNAATAKVQTALSSAQTIITVK